MLQVGLLLFFLIVFQNNLFASEKGGVIESNAEVELLYSVGDLSNDIQLNAGFNFPVREYIGASINTNIQHDRGKGDIVDAERFSLDGSLFLRDFSTGKITAFYGFERTNFDIPQTSPSPDTVDRQRYGVSVDYYLSNFTLGLIQAFNRFDPASIGTFKIFGVSGWWYPNDNIRLFLSVGFIDAEGSYSFGFVDQPNFLKNLFSVSYYYSRTENSERHNYVLTYYFDKKIALKERDRKYR